MNHIPMCSCQRGMSGNAFVECRPSMGKQVDIFFMENYNCNKYVGLVMILRKFPNLLLFYSVRHKPMQSISMWSKQ